MVNGRNKGKAGEREVCKLLQPVVDEVLGEGACVLERNLTQTRGGGYDISGLEWLALEVKRQESTFQVGWWQQAVGQAEPGQVPVLLWRRNRQPWRARLQAPVVIEQWASPALVLDMEWAQFEQWFRLRLRWQKEFGE